MEITRLSSKDRMPFKPTTTEDVIGCVNYKGRKKSLKEMEKGIMIEARKQK